MFKKGGKEMEVIPITSTLKKMMLFYDYTTICDDFKFTFVPDPDPDDERLKDRVKRIIEISNPVDYTREEIMEKFDLNTKVVKWEHIFLDDGKTPSMLVVLEKPTEDK